MQTKGRWIGAGLAALLAAATARAGDPILPPNPTDEDLATAAQNPVSDLISVPFQDIIAFGVGPQREVANVLNIQPVVPFHLTQDWNLITRTILPIVTMPNFTGGGSTTGLGNVMATAFLAPARPGAVIWGAGPVATFPTATSPQLGSQSTWGLGPSVVVAGHARPLGAGRAREQRLVGRGSEGERLPPPVLRELQLRERLVPDDRSIITANWEAPSGAEVGRPVRGGSRADRLDRTPSLQLQRPGLLPRGPARLRPELDRPPARPPSSSRGACSSSSGSSDAVSRPTKKERNRSMAKTGKPNILVLWGDDVGWWNISYNSRGQMGYRTPNIDRVANEGVAFTDYYAQQSCTAGRSAFITGQNPIRTGLSKVGHARAPTSASARRTRPSPSS